MRTSAERWQTAILERRNKPGTDGVSSAVRALLRIHFVAFARSVLPTSAMLALVAAVLFSRHGLDPRTVAHAIAPSSVARIVALLVTTAMSRSGARAVFHPPGATYLRASPLPRTTQLVVACAFVFASVAPLPLVVAFGGAPLDASLLLASLASLCLAPSMASFAVASGIAILPAPFAPIAWITLFFVVIRAHRDAPIIPRSLRRVRLPIVWPLHIVATYVRALVRSSSGRVLLAFLPPAIGVALVRVAAESDRDERARSLSAVVALLSLAPIVAHATRTLRALRPVVRASHRPRRAALVAAVAVLATPSLAFAAGTHVVAHTSALSSAFALVAVLVVAEGLLRARRRDGATLWVLFALPVTVVFTLFARARWTSPALVVALAALLVPEPEVVRARDH